MKRRHRMPAYSLTIIDRDGKQIHGKFVRVVRIMPGKLVMHFVTSTRLDSYRYAAVYTNHLDAPAASVNTRVIGVLSIDL
jgi:hypothetical protein